MRRSMNTDRAYTLGLIIKLTYGFRNRDQPHLQIFRDDERSRSEEWDIYGAVSEKETGPDSVQIVEFTGLMDTQIFELGTKFKIQFVDLTHEEINYARGGKTIEPVYYFDIEALR